MHDQGVMEVQRIIRIVGLSTSHYLFMAKKLEKPASGPKLIENKSFALRK